MLHHVVFLDDGPPGHPGARGVRRAPRPALLRHRRGAPAARPAPGLRLPAAPPGPVADAGHAHEPLRPPGAGLRAVDDADRDRAPADAGHPVLGAAERLRGQLHGPRRRSARQHGPPLRDLARAGRRAHRGRRRPPARRGAGPHREGPALPPRAARRPAALRAARRPGLRGAPGPPRARADRDPVLPLADRDPGPPGPAPADHRQLRRRAPARAGHVDPPPLPRAAAGPGRRLAARRCRATAASCCRAGDGRTDPPYEPVPFNVMDDQGVVEPVEHLPGAPTPLGPRGTVDLVGEPLRPREGRAPGRRASCAGASATPRSTTSSSPAGPPWWARRRAATGRPRRASAGPGPTGSSAPCTRSRCTRRSSSAERPMSSRAAPRPPGMTTDTTTRGGAQAAGTTPDPRASARAGSRSSCCASACS